MKIGLLGRTNWLFDSANLLVNQGHEIAFVVINRQMEKAQEQAFQAFCQQHNCPLFITNHTRDVVSEIKELGADLCVSVNFINIIPPTFLALFKHGVLNAHAGDLPRYRGNACPNWAILNNESKVGLCIHEMSEKLDAGPVYVREHLALNDNTYIGDVYNWLNNQIPRSFLAAIQKIEKCELPQPQDPTVRPLRVFPRKPEDAEIDWNQSAESILRLIRASGRPFDGAYSYLNGDQKVTIFAANLFSVDYDFCAVPGQVCFTEGRSVVVACADHLIQLSTLSVEDLDSEESVVIVTRSLRSRLTPKKNR